MNTIVESVVESNVTRCNKFFFFFLDITAPRRRRLSFFSGFRAKFQKRVTSVAFQSILRKQIRKLPKILKSVKIIQYYSILFIRVLKRDSSQRGRAQEPRELGAHAAGVPPRRHEHPPKFSLTLS